jgi:hypothetical protein
MKLMALIRNLFRRKIIPALFRDQKKKLILKRVKFGKTEL